jgi:glycosyltransferase involved in cell wall biosynthesis
MRILHIYKDYYPVLGGIENHVRVLAEAQAAAGHQVVVLAANPLRRSETRDVGGVRVILAGHLATVASTPISPALFRWAARIRTDVAHLHFPHPPGEVANLLFRPGRRTVITYHSDVVRQQAWLRLYAPFMRRVLARADRILPTSPVYLDTSPFLRPWRDRCTVVPLGVDIARFAAVPLAQVAALRTRLGLPDRPLLVFVGRLRYYKGLGDLLRALSSLPTAHLLVVGSGPMGETWRAQAAELGVSGQVTFAGEVSDAELPACYRAGRLFVLPANARAEAFGTVILEAMAAGLPVVCTEVGTGTSWVNQDGVTGLVVPPNDPLSLAAAIASLLSDPDRLHVMGQAARRAAEQRFSQAAMIAQVNGIYEEVLAAPARS